MTIIQGDDGTVTIDPLSMAETLRDAEEAGMIVDVEPLGDDEFVVRVYRPGCGI